MATRDILGISELNLKNLVCGIGNQLRYVDRFSTCRRNHKENVAEHQFYTAFFTLLIGLHLDATRRPFSLGKAVIRALIHDVEEHYTGDVIRPVKHGSIATETALNNAGAEFSRKFFDSLTRNRLHASNLFQTWKDAKDNTIEGLVVKFSDFLSVVAYLNQEVRSGNLLVMDNVKQMKEYCETFDTPEFDFIRPLINQAIKLVGDLDRTVNRNRRKR